MTMEMRAPSVESILSSQEEMMFQKVLMRDPTMTREAFKEVRENALRSTKAKEFYIVNGFLVEDRPNREDKSEFAGKN